MKNGMINEILNHLDEIVWGPVLLTLLLGTGIYLMFSLKFLPLRRLKYAIRCAVGLEGKGNSRIGQQKIRKQGVSPFSALMNELATTIGTGNIVGVATAMVLGGPGALVWMVVSALIGMATKLVESLLSLKYRIRKKQGEWAGGPMYTMINGLNFKTGRMLAKIFSFFAVCAAFGMGNMTQANSISVAFRTSFGVPQEKTGLILAILTVLVVLGGIKGISKLSTVMVPFMGVLYIATSLLVIAMNYENLWDGMVQMIGMAFCPESFGGGIVGTATVHFFDAFRWGVTRGVFSNEAGVGASCISAASADTDDYIRQSYISMTGVFFDTVVICTITGLTIASSGMLGRITASGKVMTGMELVTAIFEASLGKAGSTLLSLSVAMFAFATIAGWAYQGEKVFEFLVGNEKYNIWFRFFYSLSAFVGAVAELETVWTFSDICNGLMAVPNLICVLILSKEAVEELKKQEKTGNGTGA